MIKTASTLSVKYPVPVRMGYNARYSRYYSYNCPGNCNYSADYNYIHYSVGHNYIRCSAGLADHDKEMLRVYEEDIHHGQ